MSSTPWSWTSIAWGCREPSNWVKVPWVFGLFFLRGVGHNKKLYIYIYLVYKKTTIHSTWVDLLVGWAKWLWLNLFWLGTFCFASTWQGLVFRGGGRKLSREHGKHGNDGTAVSSQAPLPPSCKWNWIRAAGTKLMKFKSSCGSSCVGLVFQSSSKVELMKHVLPKFCNPQFNKWLIVDLGRWFGILGIHPHSNLFHKWNPGIQPTNPNHQLPISRSIARKKKVNVIWMASSNKHLLRRMLLLGIGWMTSCSLYN